MKHVLNAVAAALVFLPVSWTYAADLVTAGGSAINLCVGDSGDPCGTQKGIFTIVMTKQGANPFRIRNRVRFTGPVEVQSIEDATDCLGKVVAHTLTDWKTGSTVHTESDTVCFTGFSPDSSSPETVNFQETIDLDPSTGSNCFAGAQGQIFVEGTVYVTSGIVTFNVQPGAVVRLPAWPSCTH